MSNEGAPELKSPLSAIKQFCFECCGESRSDVKKCTGYTCALYHFRQGKNPYIKRREMTEEQKKIASERLRKARLKKQTEEEV